MGFLKKEVLQILRDPSSILLALVMPVVVLFLEGYGVTLDPDRVPIALVLGESTPQTLEIAARFQGSRYFIVERVRDSQTATDLMRHRKVDGIITIQSGFSSELTQTGSAPVQVILNGVDSNRARLIQGYAQGVLLRWAQIRIHRGEQAVLPPISVDQRIWFNESARSTNTIIPGLIALIMTMTGTLLTALVIAREWERGTMEAILVTPLRTHELLIGKVVPYYILGMMGMGIIVAAGMLVFHVPLRGSLFALTLLGSLFMLASLGLGLVFSAALRVQFVAAQAGMVAGFLPAVFLSGLLFDLESTPRFIQIVSYVVPARYFVSASHTLFMAGDIWPVLIPDAFALLVMSVCFLAIARYNLGKRLRV
jgi:ABC-2 type transport system permease protein